MKKLVTICAVATMILVVTGVSQAGLTVIGTATVDGGGSYNLIYEEAQNLVWLDYTPSEVDLKSGHKTWVAGLGSGLEVNLNPLYTTDIDWSTGWRLPSAGDSPVIGLNQTTSEMGHLFYVSLGKEAEQDPLGNMSPFVNLLEGTYWAGETSSFGRTWAFTFGSNGPKLANPAYLGDVSGLQFTPSNGEPDVTAIAVRDGTVAVVPEPATICMLGLGGLLLRKRKSA